MNFFLSDALWNSILSRHKQNMIIQPRQENGRFGQSPTLADQLAALVKIVVCTILKKYKVRPGNDCRLRCKECEANTAYVCIDCEGEPQLCNNVKPNGQYCSKKIPFS